MKELINKIPRLMMPALLGAMLAITAFAQQQPSVAGKYEGTAKTPNGDVQLTLELKEDAGKISGQVTSPHGSYNIVKAVMTDGVLTIDAEGNGTKGKMVLRPKGEALVGDFTVGGQTGAVEFKKAAAKDDISGEWDAVADAQGQAIPFTLSLKLDGDKVSGSSDSQLGHANIVSGSWKDGKFSVVLDGNVALVAVMVDGKLSGEYDYNGQGSGKWVAVRKK
jgi:hypothetical protein